MKIQLLCSALLVGLLVGSPSSAPAPIVAPVAGGTVTVDISSMQDGMTLAPGTPVEWRLRAFVSSGDNLGLALISVDLTQDPANPEKFDIPRGRAITVPMRQFDHPLGLTNPGLTLEKSGYGGTQDGTPGEQNLVQIGGAQNTFGTPMPCLGPNQDLCRGTDTDVDIGIGQGFTGQNFASGNFRVPNTPGVYQFHISNVVANVLEQVAVPPAASDVCRANAMAGNGTITFTVQ